MAFGAFCSSFNGPWPGEESKDAPEKMDSDVCMSCFLVGLYKKYISPVDGSDCPMYPTCSEYSIQCFKKHGAPMGWIMTWDRLLRCGRDELRLSPGILVNKEAKCFDPLENNDFWWYDED